MSDLTPEQLEIADLTERLKDALHDKVMADAKHLGEIEQLQAQVKELEERLRCWHEAIKENRDEY